MTTPPIEFEASGPRVLYVAWQEPESRAHRAVGRLVRTVDAEGEHLYEFAYTGGADEAIGFEPFQAFPDLDEIYRSRELLPFFTNRLMSPRRPDYPAHVARLGLTPASDPFDVLVRTGGARATDRIELFGLPEAIIEPGGDLVCHRTWFLAHGFRHLNAAEQEAALRLRTGDELEARPDPKNPVDPNAVLLLEVDHHRVGYLPRYLAADAPAGGTLGVTVAQVNPHPAPQSLRLLCRLDLHLPAGHTPFSGPEHRPRRAEDAHELHPRTAAETR